MQVYIEYVLIDNFVIDYLLLKATFSLTSVKTSKKRLILCSFLGSVFALVYPLVFKIWFFNLVGKVLFGLLLVAFCMKNFSLKQFYSCALVFFCYTFLTGGAIYGLGFLFNINFSSEVSIALLILPVFAIYKCVDMVVKFVCRKQKSSVYDYEVDVFLNNTIKKAKGFLDTGNMLYDGNSPVILCTKNFAKEFFSEKSSLPKIKFIEVKTVNGISQKPSFKLDKVVIYAGDRLNIIDNVTMCVVKNSEISDQTIILHPKLMEAKYEKQIV